MGLSGANVTPDILPRDMVNYVPKKNPYPEEPAANIPKESLNSSEIREFKEDLKVVAEKNISKAKAARNRREPSG